MTIHTEIRRFLIVLLASLIPLQFSAASAFASLTTYHPLLSYSNAFGSQTIVPSLLEVQAPYSRTAVRVREMTPRLHLTQTVDSIGRVYSLVNKQGKWTRNVAGGHKNKDEKPEESLKKPQGKVQEGWVFEGKINRMIKAALPMMIRIVDERDGLYYPEEQEIPMRAYLLAESGSVLQKDFITEEVKAKLSESARFWLKHIAIALIPEQSFVYYENPHTFRALHIGERRKTIYIGALLWDQIKENPTALAGMLAHAMVYVMFPIPKIYLFGFRLVFIGAVQRVWAYRAEGRADPSRLFRLIVVNSITVEHAVRRLIERRTHDYSLWGRDRNSEIAGFLTILDIKDQWRNYDVSSKDLDAFYAVYSAARDEGLRNFFDEYDTQTGIASTESNVNKRFHLDSFGRARKEAYSIVVLHHILDALRRRDAERQRLLRQPLRYAA